MRLCYTKAGCTCCNPKVMAYSVTILHVAEQQHVSYSIGAREPVPA